jgi:phosphoenolpyruvate carboxykinase (ATP)
MRAAPARRQRADTDVKGLPRRGSVVFYQVSSSRMEWNPSPAGLRELTEKMPNASVTEFGNVNVKARVDSRSTRSIHLVEDFVNSRGQAITRAEYERVAALQEAYIATSSMIVVDGFIGSTRRSAPGLG